MLLFFLKSCILLLYYSLENVTLLLNYSATWTEVHCIQWVFVVFKFEKKNIKAQSKERLQSNQHSESAVETCIGRNGGANTTSVIVCQFCVSMLSVQRYCVSSIIWLFLSFTIALLPFCAIRIKVMTTSPHLQSWSQHLPPSLLT